MTGRERPAQAPAFPLDVLPDELQDYVRQASGAVACPLDFIGAGILVVLGATLGTHRVIQIKPGWREAACLWIAVVARPGEAKSPALDQVLHPARVADALAHQTWLDALEAWRDTEGDENRPDRPVRERFIVSDVTMEKLAQVLQENPRGVLLHRDEFGGWIRSMNLYRGGRGSDVEDFNSIWSGQPIDVLRKTTEDAYVQRPFVAVLGGLQPDRLEELATGREDGFVDRLLLVHPPTVERRWSETTVDRDVLLSYVGLHQELLSLPAGEVPLSKTARETFATWHDHFYEWLAPRTGPVRGSAAKMPRYCARFALVLAHARRSYDLVDVQDVEGAIRLVNYFTAMIGWSSDRLVPAVGNLDRNVRELDRQARKFVEWLQAHDGTATGRELLKSRVGGIRRAVDAHRVIELLEQDGRVKTEITAAPAGKESLRVTLLAADDDGADDDDDGDNARAHERRP